MRTKKTNRILSCLLSLTMIIGLLAFMPGSVITASAAGDCPVHDGKIVWEPALNGATVVPSGRQYISNAGGQELGLFLSSSRTPPQGFTVDSGVIRHQAGGGGERMNIGIKGTSGNRADAAGFAPVDGKTYKLMLNAENEYRTGPAETLGFRLNGEVAVAAAKPVSGTLFSFTFTHEAAKATEGDSGHGLVAVGIINDSGTNGVLYYSNIRIYELDFDAKCTCPMDGGLEWNVFPAENRVSFIGQTPGGANSPNRAGQVMKLSNLGFDAEDLPTNGATLFFDFAVPHNTNRRIVAWTDLSGAKPAIEDFTFATEANQNARLLAYTEPRVSSGDSAAEIKIPQHLLYDEAGGKYASEIYVIFTTDNLGTLDAPGNQRGADMRNNVNGINLEKEFDLFKAVRLEVTPAIQFNTFITLTPGRNETEMNFSWWTPEDEAAKAVVQITDAALLTTNAKGEYVWGDSVKASGEFTGTQEYAAYGYDQNKVTATGLRPGLYGYRVGDGTPANWSIPEVFRVYDPASYNIIAIADPQLAASSSMLGRWQNTLSRAIAQADRLGGAAFILNAGDNAGYANDYNEYETLLAPKQLRSIPMFTTVGNHDTQSQRAVSHGSGPDGMDNETPLGLLSLLYNWPNHEWLSNPNAPDTSTGNPRHVDDTVRGGGNWFASYGDVLYISINSNLRTDPQHDAFLEKAVASHPDAAWKVVVSHFDPFGNGTGHSLSLGPQRDFYAPLYEKYGIDLVVNGHDHAYGRAQFVWAERDEAGSPLESGWEIAKYQYPSVLDIDELGIFSANPLGNYVAQNGVQFMSLGSPADWGKYNPTSRPWSAYIAGPLDVPPAAGEYSIISVDSNTLTFTTYRVSGGTDEKLDSITLRKKATFDDLTSLIAGMEEVPETDMRPDTWDAFKAQIASAKAVEAGAGAAAIHDAYMALYDAYYSIVSTSGKGELGYWIDATVKLLSTAVEGSWSGQFDVGSKDILQAIVDNAVYYYDLRLATQEQVDDALAQLLDSLVVFMGDDVLKLVTSLYSHALGRAPDKYGLTWWISNLAIGNITPAQLLQGFFFSAEYAGKDVTAEEFLFDCYRAILGREPEEYGYSIWMKFINDGGTALDVINGFAASDEFQTVIDSKPPCPWIYVHEIKADAPYTLGLVDWMKETDPWYIETGLGDKPYYYEHFTKFPYSHNSPYTDTTGSGGAYRTEVLFGPANLQGGRGENAAHVTKTRVGEWIRYELDVEKAGEYSAKLGAVNRTASEQWVILRDDAQNVLTQFKIAANTALPATGWADAGLFEGSDTFYLPEGRFILEMFFMGNGTATSTTVDVHSDGPDVDIIILERIGDMEAPVVEKDPLVWDLPFFFTLIGGDSTHRQRGWGTDGHTNSVTPWEAYGLPVEVYNRTVKVVLEVAARPGSAGGSTTQIHLQNDGGGTWLPEWAPLTTDIYDPDIGLNGALVWDISDMPEPFSVHWPTIAATEAWGEFDISFYSPNWEELNYMRAYLILSEPIG